MSFPRFITASILFSVSVLMCFSLNAQSKKAKASSKEKSALSLAAYEKYIDESNDARLKEFTELVYIPSISSMPSHKADVERAAQWIQNKMKSIGLDNAQLIPTAGNPIVFGSWEKAPGKPTVVIYAHYDVQPVKEAEWHIPPFAPKVENEKVFGRGASDDKSGVMITLWAIETMLHADGKLPVNVKFMFEGEEEIGSVNFKDFITKNKDLVKADFALNADGDQFDENTPSMLMSLRGGAQLEFNVKTANIDAHSGQFGGKTPNSALAMAQIIASFFDKKGNVAVEGFYDKVVPLTAEQKTMMAKVPYNKADDMKLLGTTAEFGDTAYSSLERIWYRPTLEIVGMQSGYTAAEGFSNIVPGNAMARITCRLVSNQSSKEIIDLIVKHINKNAPEGATITYKFRPIEISPVSFPADTKAYRYVAETLTKIYGKEPLQVATGGSVGSLIDIKNQLGLYAYSMGFQLPDEQWHSANEFLRVSSIRKGQLAYCYYLQLLAKGEGKK
ncbi:MAG: M20/M25/M40 family metallo-hydrolase [Chitinophagaceae bacterium]